MALSRADLTLAPATVKMADGREFIVRRLDALARADYQALCGDQSKAIPADASMSVRLRALKVLEGELLFRTVLQADGSLMFTSGEDAASALSEEDLDELGVLIAKVNHLGPTDPNA